ncbi:hypothetical protein Pvag_pPag20168 (plasmid) [Pantoea vagans C9-1]|nr:hypothetical protein Pvag_pPag20168 [Pantoea vagans C9-1]
MLAILKVFFMIYLICLRRQAEGDAAALRTAAKDINVLSVCDG